MLACSGLILFSLIIDSGIGELPIPGDPIIASSPAISGAPKLDISPSIGTRFLTSFERESNFLL